MNKAKYIDHTNLKAMTIKSDITKLLDEAKKYHFKSVCVNPYYVSYAKEVLRDTDVLVCTVIGFPLGQNTTETKVYETKDAILKGADEIDMVLNVAALKDGLLDAYKEFLVEYQAIGGKIIQFDDCLWELFADDNDKSFFEQGQKGLEDLADEFVAINNEIIDFAHKLGLKVWTHNCRGNYQSRHAAGGSYQAIAEKFLRDQHYDRFFLEWDDERAGDIQALEVLKE